MLKPICCAELSVHIAHKHVAQTGVGYCLVAYEQQMKRHVPISHCPWCGSELQTKEDRSFALSFFAP